MEASLEAAEAGDRIREASEEHRTRDEPQTSHESRTRDELFRRLAAVGIGVLALLLALANFGGATATKETINNNILASDAYNFFQAKNIRQTQNQLAIDELETLLVTQPSLTSEAQAHIQQRIDQYTATVARYETRGVISAPRDRFKVAAPINWGRKRRGSVRLATGRLGWA